MRVILEITTGPNVGRRALVRDAKQFTVGRSEDAMFSIPVDQRLSRIHFSLSTVHDSCELTDEQSANGTFVNGERITHHRLAPGDRIQAGGTEFAVHFENVSSPATPSATTPSPGSGFTPSANMNKATDLDLGASLPFTPSEQAAAKMTGHRDAAANPPPKAGGMPFGAPEEKPPTTPQQFRSTIVGPNPLLSGAGAKPFADHLHAAEKTQPTGGRVSLAAISGPAKGRQFMLTPNKTSNVGRSEEVDVSVPSDGQMSRIHFSVTLGANGCQLLDERSANGTVVNGQRVREAWLNSGDEVQAGQTKFVVHFGEPAAPKSDAAFPTPQPAADPQSALRGTQIMPEGGFGGSGGSGRPDLTSTIIGPSNPAPGAGFPIDDDSVDLGGPAPKIGSGPKSDSPRPSDNIPPVFGGGNIRETTIQHDEQGGTTYTPPEVPPWMRTAEKAPLPPQAATKPDDAMPPFDLAGPEIPVADKAIEPNQEPDEEVAPFAAPSSDDVPPWMVSHEPESRPEPTEPPQPPSEPPLPPPQEQPIVPPMPSGGGGNIRETTIQHDEQGGATYTPPEVPPWMRAAEKAPPQKSVEAAPAKRPEGKRSEARKPIPQPRASIAPGPMPSDDDDAPMDLAGPREPASGFDLRTTATPKSPWELMPNPATPPNSSGEGTSQPAEPETISVEQAVAGTVFEYGLQEKHPGVRQAILLSAAWGRRTWLLQYLREQSEELRPENWPIFWLLAMLAESDDIETVRAAGEFEGFGPRRLRLWGSLGHPSLIEPLIPQMQHRDPRIAITAATAFTRITGRSVNSGSSRNDMPLPDIGLAEEIWAEAKPHFQKGQRYGTGIDLSKHPDKQTLSRLDMQTRWETCLRGRYRGQWRGRLMEIEKFPQF